MIKVYDGRNGNRGWLNAILNSRNNAYDLDKVDSVRKIVECVRNEGDKAILEYCSRFDNANFDSAESLLVTQSELEEAYSKVSNDFIEAIRKAKSRIINFHKRQLQNSWIMFEEDGCVLGQKLLPLEKVGVYVPGGRASYPSSVLMNVIPAKIAGVKNIVMVTPSDSTGKISHHTLVAASEAGCDTIFKVGGAHAIAALAYGTKTIPKVDKIVGPGNIYVTLAKKEVFGIVDIDMLAGPSEVLIIADSSANPKFLAADMMSQAEHDPMAQAFLFTDNENIVSETLKELERQVEYMDKKSIIKESLANCGAIAAFDNISDAIDLANTIAPEHLELCISSPFERLGLVRNAGSIFLGNHTPEALGDYIAGPNHVLPTNGSARFFSPLSVDHFIKKSSIISFTKDAFESIAEDVIKLSTAESLSAHANSVKVRLIC